MGSVAVQLSCPTCNFIDNERQGTWWYSASKRIRRKNPAHRTCRKSSNGHEGTRSGRAINEAHKFRTWEDAERGGDFAPERHWQLRLAATWAIQQARDVVASVYNAAGATRSSTRTRSSAASATSTPGPSKAKTAPSISKLSARSSSACRRKEGISG